MTGRMATYAALGAFAPTLRWLWCQGMLTSHHSWTRSAQAPCAGTQRWWFDSIRRRVSRTLTGRIRKDSSRSLSSARLLRSLICDPMLGSYCAPRTHWRSILRSREKRINPEMIWAVVQRGNRSKQNFTKWGAGLGALVLHPATLESWRIIWKPTNLWPIESEWHLLRCTGRYLYTDKLASVETKEPHSQSQSQNASS